MSDEPWGADPTADDAGTTPPPLPPELAACLTALAADVEALSTFDLTQLEGAAALAADAALTAAVSRLSAVAARVLPVVEADGPWAARGGAASFATWVARRHGVFGPNSEILDVGRAERTFTGHMRSAIIARDKHCRYPGCTVPPAISEGHHVKHWSRDHGETSVANGILLCWFHHDHVHQRNIEIRWSSSGWLFERDGIRIESLLAPGSVGAEPGDA